MCKQLFSNLLEIKLQRKYYLEYAIKLNNQTLQKSYTLEKKKCKLFKSEFWLVSTYVVKILDHLNENWSSN